MTLGLAAAAVIAGSVGLAGKAEALPSYITLNGSPSSTLADGALNWTLSSCSTGTTNVCASLVMYANNGALTFAGLPNVGNTAFQPLSSVFASGSVTDLTVDVTATTANGLNGIGGASVAASGTIGVTSGGTGTVFPGGSFSGLGSFIIGLPGSGGTYPQSVSFNPVNSVEFSMDIPLSGTLNTVTYGGTPVPEPGALSLLAVSLLMMGAVRFRAARR